MALTAAKVEKATRLLITLEQRIVKAIAIAGVMNAGVLRSAELQVALVGTQKDALSSVFSNGVVSAETVLAALETKVKGSTTITPAPPGSGITDWATALTALTAVIDPEAGANFHQQLLGSFTQNLNLSRGDDGELTAEAVRAEFLVKVADALKNRGEKIRLLLTLLRALGA